VSYFICLNYIFNLLKSFQHSANYRHNNLKQDINSLYVNFHSQDTKEAYAWNRPHCHWRTL